VRGTVGQWGLPADTDVRVLNLSENATFALWDPVGGRRLALRVSRLGYSSPAEIASELAWIEALQGDAVVETAPPVAGVDGAFVQTLASTGGFAARQAVAFTWLDGAEPVAEAGLVPWFEVLGGLTARMHAHARRWERPAGFVRKRWDLEAMIGENGFWGPWRAGIGLDGAGIAVIEQAIAGIADHLAAYGAGPERFGLVHADLRLANLLTEGGKLRVIDFDDCGFSWFAYDFAASISFLEDEPIVPALRDAWLAGYRREAEFSAEDEAALASFVMLRRILLTAWLASHAEIPFARDTAPGYAPGTVRLARDYLAGRMFAAIP